MISSLQCLSLEINLVSSFSPVSFSLHTSFVTRIRQPMKCDHWLLAQSHQNCHLHSHFRSQANQWPFLPQRSQKEDTFDG